MVRPSHRRRGVLATGALARLVATAFLVLAPAGIDAEDLKEIAGNGVLRLLVSADEQPEMFALNQAAAPGFEREIIEGFAKTHQLRLEITTVPTFDQIVPTLIKGDGDLIIGIIDTPVRRKQIDFTIETLPARHLVVNRRPASPVNSLEELRRIRVAVVRGTSWSEAAVGAGVKPANTSSFPDLPGVLGALQSGKAAATVMSAPDFALAQTRDPSLQAGMFIGAPTSAAWGVRKGDIALREALDDYIYTLRGSPSWGPLVAKYFSSAALELFRRARRP